MFCLFDYLRVMICGRTLLRARVFVYFDHVIRKSHFNCPVHYTVTSDHPSPGGKGVLLHLTSLMCVCVCVRGVCHCGSLNTHRIRRRSFLAGCCCRLRLLLVSGLCVRVVVKEGVGECINNGVPDASTVRRTMRQLS